MNTTDYLTLSSTIQRLLSGSESVILAIDGRCASGKTTLATKLQDEFQCNVIHMDDFYLPIHLREPGWENTPGKNIDFDRLKEIIKTIPFKKQYQICPYICAAGCYGKPIHYKQNRLTVVEGSYSCHPVLKEYYHYCVFMDISKEHQKNRLLIRNGEEGYTRFNNLWIPLEEQYFKNHSVKEQCDITIAN